MSEPVYGIPFPIVYGPEFNTLAETPVNWGMSRCFVDRLREAGGDGDGEVIAILDTGMDASHFEFNGRVLDARSFISGENEYDGNGHGTHCGGTAGGQSRGIGVAGKCRFVNGKCLSNGGSGGNTGIRAAIKWAKTVGATVLSMSIGGPGFLASIEDLMQEVIAAGIIPVVAAGNERQQGGVVTFPSSAIVVAAVDSADRYANFSNPASTGAILSVAAPGVQIPSARPGGGYQVMSGTSMATPFVAGVVAAVQSARVKRGLSRLSTSQVKSLFTTRLVDAGTPGPDKDYGPGLIDCDAFVRSFTLNPVIQP